MPDSPASRTPAHNTALPATLPALAALTTQGVQAVWVPAPQDVCGPRRGPPLTCGLLRGRPPLPGRLAGVAIFKGGAMGCLLVVVCRACVCSGSEARRHRLMPRVHPFTCPPTHPPVLLTHHPPTQQDSYHSTDSRRSGLPIIAMVGGGGPGAGLGIAPGPVAGSIQGGSIAGGRSAPPSVANLYYPDSSQHRPVPARTGSYGMSAVGAPKLGLGRGAARALGCRALGVWLPATTAGAQPLRLRHRQAHQAVLNSAPAALPPNPPTNAGRRGADICTAATQRPGTVPKVALAALARPRGCACSTFLG